MQTSLPMALVALSCVFCGCSTHRAPAPTRLVQPPAARGGGPLSMVTAVDEIAAAHCAHASGCGQLGSGRRFLTMDDCRRVLATETRTRWSTTTCDSGYVEADELARCVSRVHRGRCDRDVAGLCSPTTMCSP